ncbi:plasma membrane calcium [Exophiala xenobiotica]|nr:plasma membrane calcium [Exophiala xenobiotica]KAK5247311.1 plasma membrane calcium [Exophiala xenobiotica]KAK5346179.1 plasma membrane calcium [Exophiala xenobiotica]KAK5359402.1 plasma membrane calcium [Exophiala xenobiotica]KAK5365469.1 plasma membrane calcium [Exophiala xenobiotica]
MAGQNPSAPKITLDTSNLSEHNTTSSHRRGLSMSTPPQTAVDESSYLSPTSPSKHTFDGSTLNSHDGATRLRSNSGISATSSATAYSKSSLDYESPDDALRPDKGNEKDFVVQNNPFAFSPGQLNKLLNPKSLSAYKALGGLKGLEKGLRTSLTAGLSVDENRLDGSISFEEATAAADNSKAFADIPLSSEPAKSEQREAKSNQFDDRLRVFKDNRLPERKPDGILTLIWRAYNDKILILLTIAAVVSLALGIYETVDAGTGVEWVEGVAICVAITIVVTVGAANDWQKERQFVKLSKRKDDREVKVIRSGKSVQISVHDITVGDVLHLEPGDAIPADGVFISGHGVKCDESSATGESDMMKKTPGEEVWQRIQDGTATAKLDPFIISGAKVLEGVGTYLVTSVGTNSSYGKILMSLQANNDPTPLQVKLGKLANWIGGLGSSAAVLLFFVLLIKFLTNLSSDDRPGAVKAQEFLDILIVAITVIVVAVPEGLPLAVTLALAFATTRMLKENNLVRVLRACETMGNATTICSDKTGTLTQNKMTVVAGTLGSDQQFASTASNNNKEKSSPASFANMFSKLGAELKELLRLSITLNSTAFEGEEKGVPTFIGSKTEVAMLTLAKEQLGLEHLATERSNYKIKQLIPFDSGRKCMGIVIKHNGGYRLLVKGAAEIMASKAAHTVSSIYAQDGPYQVVDMTAEEKEAIAATIDDYAQHSLRTIGMLYKDFPQWPPAGAKTLEEDPKSVVFDDIFHDLTWLGVVGIHDPLREGVVEAVAQCQHSGVVVRMVTGDNLTTARSIAIDCGILHPDEAGIVMEGPKFRQLSDEEMDAILPKLRVLARSSPEDKRILVSRLKHLGETVAVTGDGTNDGPALKMADVGFSMGIAGTEVAKEASSIILLDDNFSSTITALMWGRAVNDAVKKFLQFQITVNITAVILTFVSAVASDSNHSVLTAVQLLWVNLIMDTLAALALATDAPTKKILDRPPQPKSQPLITINMWKMITGQAVYQLVVTFVLYFAGMSIFSYEMHQRIELNTIVFNSFVWMQIFNEFNNRRLDNKFNIFEGIHRNFWFIGINCIMVGGQIMIIFVGGQAFSITRLNGVQWAISLLTALPCLLWGVLVRCFPDAWFAVVFNGAVGAMTVVLRPISKVLHIIFHPVAQVFRAISRFTKRTVRKMTGKKPSSEGDEQSVDDEEYLTENKATAVDQETGMPSMPTFMSTEPVKVSPNVDDKVNPIVNANHARHVSDVPSLSVTGPS